MQRKMADIFSLVQPQSPLRGTFTAGDTVEIHTNYDRLVGHGWIDPAGDNETLATLTSEGAAIINRFRDLMQEERLKEELGKGAGEFVDKALAEETDWSLVTVTDTFVVIEDERGRRRRYHSPSEEQLLHP